MPTPYLAAMAASALIEPGDFDRQSRSTKIDEARSG
jgi:hypothetical protein